MDNLNKTSCKNNHPKRFSATLITLLIITMALFMVDFSSAFLNSSVETYWNFNESSGLIVDRVSKINFTAQGSPLFDTSGVVAGAIGMTSNFQGFQNTTGSVTSVLDFGTAGDYAFSVWINVTGIQGGNPIFFATNNRSDPGWSIIGGNLNNIIQWRTTTTGAGVTLTIDGDLPVNEFSMITGVRNNSGADFYLFVDGVLNQTALGQTPQDANADIITIGSVAHPQLQNFSFDEFGIWSRSLNQSEVDELYNNGNGITFPLFTPSTETIALESPGNNTIISDVGADFRVAGDVGILFNVTNVTYSVWNSTGLFNISTVTFAGNQEFNESLFIDSFIINDYTWNAEVCWNFRTNSTNGGCAIAPTNFTFSVSPISILAQTFQPTIIEGSIGRFTVNVSVLSGFRLSTLRLNYNGTEYTPLSTTEYINQKYYGVIDINIPFVDADAITPFFWNITLENGDFDTSTLINQTVLNYSLDNCGSGTFVLFNYTMFDEDDQTVLNGVDENTTMRYDLTLFKTDGNATPVFNFSTFYNRTNPASVCGNIDLATSSFSATSVMEYFSDGRFKEFYHIQNYTLTNTTDFVNISLFNLDSTVGQIFKIVYKGIDFVPVEDVLIQVQRKYINEGLFKTVEIPKSGSNGDTVAHLIPNDAIYNLIFIKDGIVLDTFTNVIATCQNPAISECEINLNAFVTGSNLLDLVIDSEFFSSLSFNKDTMEVSSTFGVVSGIPGTVVLNVTKQDNLGHTNVCSDTLTASGGTLTCVVPESFGNSTIRAVLTLNGDIKREGVISLNPSPKDQFGGALVFLSIVMLLFLFGIGVSDSPAIHGIILIFGLIILVALNLVYSESFLGPGATILWFIIAVVIVLIKGGPKR